VDLAAHVASLPPADPPRELDGDPERGQQLYVTCQACHGPDGKGMQAVGGPNLVVSSDWYLLSQLEKFKTGIRGTNPADVAGMRMRPMSMTLPDEQAMRDVIAYIMTLRD
jgi:cytochrome c553